jgi:hypothetical protein
LRTGQIVATVINAMGGLKNGKAASPLDCMLFKPPEPEPDAEATARTALAHGKHRQSSR